jgi:hypothetical protein
MVRDNEGIPAYKKSAIMKGFRKKQKKCGLSHIFICRGHSSPGDVNMKHQTDLVILLARRHFAQMFMDLD